LALAGSEEYVPATAFLEHPLRDVEVLPFDSIVFQIISLQVLFKMRDDLVFDC
jgi:hypothetical protein